MEFKSPIETVAEPKRKRGRRKRRRMELQIISEAQMNGMLPLDYMLAVIRDPNASASRRDRMATAAAPYCHARITEQQPRLPPKGKKDMQAEAAAMAGIGTEWADDLEFDKAAN